MSSGIVRRLFISGLLAVVAPVPALAATASTTIDIRVTITAECKIVSGVALEFGSHGVLDSVADGTGSFNLVCTNGTPYDIGLGFGTSAQGSLTARYLTAGTATVSYNLYKDAAHSVLWGTVSPSDTVTGTGTGAEQVYSIYGRVPVQTTPAAGVYNDTVAITVTY